VRYVSLIAKQPKGIRIFANRGTSGIDGSNSTAVGTALVSGKLTTLITGDMAFFYDRNAFWHNYPLNNLRVIVLNNHGGGIFRLIKGPSDQPELEEYFETRQTLNAKNTAADFGFDYIAASDLDGLEQSIPNFFEASERPKLLEVFSESKINQEIFNQYKKHINNNYGE
jgi:2-succinyl-5-enolpyruvyl-6-hydroxy-3-cyclohexene-1-carboxylate synthase